MKPAPILLILLGLTAIAADYELCYRQETGEILTMTSTGPLDSTNFANSTVVEITSNDFNQVITNAWGSYIYTNGTLAVPTSNEVAAIHAYKLARSDFYVGGGQARFNVPYVTYGHMTATFPMGPFTNCIGTIHPDDKITNYVSQLSRAQSMSLNTTNGTITTLADGIYQISYNVSFRMTNDGYPQTSTNSAVIFTNGVWTGESVSVLEVSGPAWVNGSGGLLGQFSSNTVVDLRLHHTIGTNYVLESVWQLRAVKY